jgi:hypothetical protein
MSAAADALHLHDPQTLYRHWEESQWSPWDIDLSTDREQWETMEDRSLVSFVLGSLMVAEERITTKFSGTPPAGAEVSVLGASADDLRAFALDGLTHRLKIIGVPLDTL